jgi:hypothetical protein
MGATFEVAGRYLAGVGSIPAEQACAVGCVTLNDVTLPPSGPWAVHTAPLAMLPQRRQRRS